MVVHIAVYIFTFTIGVLLGAFFLIKHNFLKNEKMKNECLRYEAYYKMLLLWLREKQNGHLLSKWLKDNGYNRIAIYGMNEIGELLYCELKESDIEIECLIDKNAGTISSKYSVISPYDVKENQDAIIVTAIYYYDTIKRDLEKIVNCQILSLNDILYRIDV